MKEISRLRAALLRAGEALDDGDLVYAREIVRAALEDGERTLCCQECRIPFRFPGELAEHERWVHWREAA